MPLEPQEDESAIPDYFVTPDLPIQMEKEVMLE